MTSYRPLILSSRFWLTVLSTCFYLSSAAARSKSHTTVIVVNNQKQCFDHNNKPIKCPTSKAWIIGLAIAGGVVGLIVLVALLYFCCGCASCACGSCALCCCLCCSKRKKSSTGQVYEALPEQSNGNNVLPTYNPNPGMTTSIPYDPPSDVPRLSTFVEPSSEKPGSYNDPYSGTGEGEAASYFNSMPELGYAYKSSPSSSKISLPQTDIPPTYEQYHPPSYPPSVAH